MIGGLNIEQILRDLDPYEIRCALNGEGKYIKVEMQDFNVGSTVKNTQSFGEHGKGKGVIVFSKETFEDFLYEFDIDC